MYNAVTDDQIQRAMLIIDAHVEEQTCLIQDDAWYKKLYRIVSFRLNRAWLWFSDREAYDFQTEFIDYQRQRACRQLD